jgi:hypothetical protein
LNVDPLKLINKLEVKCQLNDGTPILQSLTGEDAQKILKTLNQTKVGEVPEDIQRS